MCEAGEAMLAVAGDEADDDISVGSGSPRPMSHPDTDDSMVDVEDSGGEGEAEDAGPKVEPPDAAMSPGPGGPRTPPAAHQPNNQQHHRALKFSIDNILKPDFGRRTGEASEQPVDLSRVTPRGAKEAGRGLGGLPPLHQPPAAPAKERDASGATLWPAWVYCTRYSDRPSAGPRTRRIKKRDKKDEKRPRTAFTSDQLARLKKEFQENSRYLTEKRRQDLARDLGLNESQIKIWFQNKRAKIKKVSRYMEVRCPHNQQAKGQVNPLALQLMAQGLYNHSTIPIREEDEDKLLPPV